MATIGAGGAPVSCSYQDNPPGDDEDDESDYSCGNFTLLSDVHDHGVDNGSFSNDDFSGLVFGNLPYCYTTTDMHLLAQSPAHRKPPALLIPSYSASILDSPSSIRTRASSASTSLCQSMSSFSTRSISTVIDCLFPPHKPNTLIAASSFGSITSHDIETGSVLQRYHRGGHCNGGYCDSGVSRIDGGLFRQRRGAGVDGVCNRQSGRGGAYLPIDTKNFLLRKASHDGENILHYGRYDNHIYHYDYCPHTLSCITSSHSIYHHNYHQEIHRQSYMQQHPLIYAGTGSGDVLVFDDRFASISQRPCLRLRSCHIGEIVGVRGGVYGHCPFSVLTAGAYDGWLKLFDLRFPNHQHSPFHSTSDSLGALLLPSLEVNRSQVSAPRSPSVDGTSPSTSSPRFTLPTTSSFSSSVASPIEAIQVFVPSPAPKKSASKSAPSPSTSSQAGSSSKLQSSIDHFAQHPPKRRLNPRLTAMDTSIDSAIVAVANQDGDVSLFSLPLSFRHLVSFSFCGGEERSISSLEFTFNAKHLLVSASSAPTKSSAPPFSLAQQKTPSSQTSYFAFLADNFQMNRTVCLKTPADGAPAFSEHFMLVEPNAITKDEASFIEKKDRKQRSFSICGSKKTQGPLGEKEMGGRSFSDYSGSEEERKNGCACQCHTARRDCESSALPYCSNDEVEEDKADGRISGARLLHLHTPASPFLDRLRRLFWRSAGDSSVSIDGENDPRGANKDTDVHTKKPLSNSNSISNSAPLFSSSPQASAAANERVKRWEGKCECCNDAFLDFKRSEDDREDSGPIDGDNDEDSKPQAVGPIVDVDSACLGPRKSSGFGQDGEKESPNDNSTSAEPPNTSRLFSRMHPQVAEFTSSCGILHPTYGRVDCYDAPFVVSMWGGIVVGRGGSSVYPSRSLNLWDAATGVCLSSSVFPEAEPCRVKRIVPHPDVVTGVLVTAGVGPPRGPSPNSVGDSSCTGRSVGGFTVWKVVHRDAFIEDALRDPSVALSLDHDDCC